MVRQAVGLLLLLIIPVGCGTTSGARAGSSDVLTREEIQAVHTSNAYELLQQLRPQFLRSRGTLSLRNPRAGQTVVYINDVRYGGIDSLRGIATEEIEEIRFISAADATTRWGTGHAGGVIQVRASY